MDKLIFLLKNYIKKIGKCQGKIRGLSLENGLFLGLIKLFGSFGLISLFFELFGFEDRAEWNAFFVEVFGYGFRFVEGSAEVLAGKVSLAGLRDACFASSGSVLRASE